ncbi:hypothetical protein [Ottowia sp. oral taxon 894]|jgi:hypothetical protein|uniref:hypothetical protein n=1 Tax=Ottowia sp. oral taxon 894 TaxID=1658672 RepID=UPI0012E23F03|nr:hypothetical protein [Ottowia sp. oral taxon 894]
MKKGKTKKGRDFASFFNSRQLPIHGRWRTIGRIFAFIGHFFAGRFGCSPWYIKNRSEFKELKCRFALVSLGHDAMNKEAPILLASSHV